LIKILSSMSVTLAITVTSKPDQVSHRRSTSNTTSLRMWPRCGADWTVSPQW